MARIAHHLRPPMYDLIVTSNRTTPWRRLRIAIVSRTDASGSGSGSVADLEAQALALSGHEILRVVRETPAATSPVESLTARKVPGDAFIRDLCGYDISGLKLLAILHDFRPDLVHFHDFVVAFGIRTARRVASVLPVVVTLHDYSGFSGGCLMSPDCNRFEAQCGSCPRIGKWPLVSPVDRTTQTHHAIQKMAKLPNVIATCPSRVFLRMARLGAWRAGTLAQINNPVDTALFHPSLRYAARCRMGLDDGTTVVLFMAARLADPRKGIEALRDVLPTVFANDRRAQFHTAGQFASLPEWLQSSRIRHHGLLHSRAAAAELLAAADVVTVPSLAENAPCVIAEALSCGTPVVAHSVGGIPEMLEGIPGSALVPPGSAEAFSRALATVIGASTPSMRERVAAVAHERYSIDGTVARLEELYFRLTSRPIAPES